MYEDSVHPNRPKPDPGFLSRVLRPLSLIVVSLVVSVATVRADGPALTDLDVKAALMGIIGSFANWPDGTFSSESDPIILGVFGEDPFGPVLERVLSEKRIHGRRIEIRRFTENAGSLEECHLLFVSRSVADNPQVLAPLRGKPVLMFSDDERLWRAEDVHVNFFLVGRKPTGDSGKVSYDVNSDALDRSGIRVRSQVKVNSRNKGGRR